MRDAILIFEGDNALRKSLRDWLKTIYHQYEIIEAADAAQAISLAEARSPRMILADADLPDKEGIETIRRLKAVAPAAEVVALAMDAHTALREAATAAGASAAVDKWDIGEELRPTLTALVPTKDRAGPERSVIEGQPSRQVGGRRAPRPGVSTAPAGQLTTQKILVFAMLLGLVAALVGVGMAAFFRDIETSSDNTFSAGTLDLSIDGENPLASAKFSVSNFRPGDEQAMVWRVCNEGTLDGYLDLRDITITSYENGCLEPESSAGDTTCGSPGQGEGELQDLVGVNLFWDEDCSGTSDSGERKIYRRSDGPVAGMAGSYDEDKPLPAGQCVCIVADFAWASDRYGDDNLGQGDALELDITFELSQEPDQ